MNDTSSLRESWTTTGYVTLDGLFGEPELADAESAVGDWAARQMEDWSGTPYTGANFKTDFYSAWQAAGKPPFRRSPVRNLTHPRFYAFLRSKALLDLVGAVLQTDEISVHGIFNARPMLPGAAPTPWHQDAQYWREHGEPDAGNPALRRRVVSVWIPLQDLDPELGGLEIASLDATQRVLFDDHYREAESALLSIEPEKIAGLTGEIPLLRRGGAIAFTPLTVHRGTPNRAQRIRWSVDVRYEATDGAMVSGRKYGFIARSGSGRYAEDSLETWRARCIGNLT